MPHDGKPEIFLSIPDDVSDSEKLHMRAQQVMQAAIFSFGSPESDLAPNPSVGEIIDVLAFATALLMSTDSSMRTASSIRKGGDLIGTRIGRYARVIVDNGDTTAADLLAMLGFHVNRPS